MDRWKELIVYLAAFTGPLAGNLVLSLLGTLGDSWGVEPVDVLVSIPAFMFPFALVQLFAGAISAAYDRRTTLLVGLGTYAAGSVMAGLSTSLDVFLVARVVQGVGYAFVNPILVAVLSDVARPSRQGQAMGFFGSSTTAGISVGPLLGGAFADIDWRIAFFVIAGLATAIFTLVWFVFEDSRRQPARVSAGKVRSQLSAATRRGHMGYIASLSAAGFLAFMAFVGVISFVSEFLETGPLQLSPERIGLALSASGVVGIFVAPAAGALVDRRGPRCCVAVGFAIVCASAFALQFAVEYYQFVGLLVMSGFGGAFVWSSLLTMVVAVPDGVKDASSSLFNSCRFFGYAVAPLVMAPIYLSEGFDTVMVICTGIGLVALSFAVLPRRAVREG